jgi:hypothetical protein
MRGSGEIWVAERLTRFTNLVVLDPSNSLSNYRFDGSWQSNTGEYSLVSKINWGVDRVRAQATQRPGKIDR